MAVATYNTDLNDFCLMETGDTFFEFTGYALGDNAVLETDWYLQGSSCASDEANNKTGVGHSIGHDYGSTPTYNTDDCFFAWMYCQGPNAVDTYANGGYRVLMGSAAGTFYGWAVGGRDVAPNPKGGWKNVVVDPTHTADYTSGTPTNWRYAGVAFNMSSGIGKGRPINADAYRWGRGDLYVENGQAGSYGTFAGMAAANDASSAHWGLFSELYGGYLWKGLMSLGTSTTSVDFRDTGVNISIDDTPKTYASFNRIEINNASSNVEWTRISITNTNASGLSKGEFEMIDNATVDLTACSFTSMSTFTFLSNASLVRCNFVNCGVITHGGADFDSCAFSEYEGTAGTSYLAYNINADIDGEIDNCSFTKGTAATHAISFGTSAPATHTLRGLSFSGYHATAQNNDSALYFADTGSDRTWTINLVGCTGDISAYKARSGDTVNFVVDPVTTGITVKDLTSGTLLQSARVLVWVTNNANYFYQASVTVSGSGTAASVSHTAHGLSTNDYVIIEDCTDDAYNGTFQVTVSNVNTYTYTTVDTITSSSISAKSTFAVISGTTDASGYISDTRSYSADQPILGRVRLASTTISSQTVYLQQGVISGTIDNATGFTITVQLVRDG